jgi:SAM-dependent methyltransferase
MAKHQITRQLDKMRDDWDQRARQNARYYVATGQGAWTDDEFFQSGEQNLREQILTDLENICRGKDPLQMKVLEIGCGAGRITRALARFFGEVYAVDISGEMVEQARQSLRSQPNAHIFQNNGRDLGVLRDAGLRDGEVDFAFSYIVFQHIPSREIIETYVREVERLLRPGALFKFQVQGFTAMDTDPDDTWLGAPFTEADAAAMAESCGFEMRYNHGAGEQYYWLWFFKKG